MNDIYILMIIALAVLAIIDLIVGVSNDAVNFLNSAIGSKVFSLKKILIISSLGVLIGSLTSNGMMEIARKGIFFPGQFHFDEIMYIFMAVMIADIILIDTFNTLGLPTSTTISIVFELLGAAMAISIIKILKDEHLSLTDLSMYINYETAIIIIIGIVLSIFIAFSMGTLVQFISRMIYSFNFSETPDYINAIFGGTSITAITYFLLIKGIKGTKFYLEIQYLLIEHSLKIIIVSFLFWTIFSYFLISLFKTNILKVIIAIGTFSLAMAFTGNDLINFIGVPVAAWNSYQAWSVSGVAPESFSMGLLSKRMPSNNVLLICSGIIMILTLWFSKKSKMIIETQMSLSRQGHGHERFKPNSISRLIVRLAILIHRFFKKMIPSKTLIYIDSRFENNKDDFTNSKIKNIPPFDMVRASVNLVLTSVLISIGTSLKLPLSTTYVTFMVAMGTSLADRAWGREIAVYRIAGVLNIIGSWFLTALIAFVFSMVIAYLIYLGKTMMIGIMLIFILFLLGNNYLKYKRSEKKRMLDLKKEEEIMKTIHSIIKNSSEKMYSAIKRIKNMYRNTIFNLINENLDGLKKNNKSIKKLNQDIEVLRSDVFYFIKSLDENSVIASKFYILALECIQNVSQSVGYISKINFQHIDNNHKKLKKEQINDLEFIEKELEKIFVKMLLFFEKNNFKSIQKIISKKNILLEKVSNSIEDQINRIRTTETSPKNSNLYFGIILETKNLISALTHLSELYQNYYTNFQIFKDEIKQS